MMNEALDAIEAVITRYSNAKIDAAECAGQLHTLCAELSDGVEAANTERDRRNHLQASIAASYMQNKTA